MKNQKKNLTRSPLHYNGNKHSIGNQILEIIDYKYKTWIEPFGGTAIIGLNSSSEKVCINDINENLMDLLKYFKRIKQDEIDVLISKTEKFKLSSDINKFSYLRKNNGTKGYSEINRSGYQKLKEDYSKTRNLGDLFLLSNYSFNRMIRFNGDGKFNVPVGKGDFSNRQITYLKEYSKALKSKKTSISSVDYKKFINKEKKRDGLIYLDPPYLNGNAQYNNIWNSDKEKELYEFIDSLNDEGYKFALSNTLFLNGMKNDILDKWMIKYKVYNINKKYNKTSHNKKVRNDAQEILVTNI